MRLSRTAVDRVAEQGVADRGHVDADLVGTSSLQPAFDQRGVVENVQAAPMGHCPFAPLAFDDRDLLAVGRGAGERRVDFALARLWHAIDDREVAAVDRMGSELLCKPLVCYVGLGDDEQAGSVLVDAVDDSRTGDAADPRKRSAAMMK